jgi:hypothetical protein
VELLRWGGEFDVKIKKLPLFLAHTHANSSNKWTGAESRDHA